LSMVASVPRAQHTTDLHFACAASDDVHAPAEVDARNLLVHCKTMVELLELQLGLRSSLPQAAAAIDQGVADSANPLPLGNLPMPQSQPASELQLRMPPPMQPPRRRIMSLSQLSQGELPLQLPPPRLNLLRAPASLPPPASQPAHAALLQQTHLPLHLPVTGCPAFTSYLGGSGQAAGVSPFPSLPSLPLSAMRPCMPPPPAQPSAMPLASQHPNTAALLQLLQDAEQHSAAVVSQLPPTTAPPHTRGDFPNT